MDTLNDELVEKILKNDEELKKKYPSCYEGEPLCPHCGYLYRSHWEGAIDGISWANFHGTELSWNDSDDGDMEQIECPKCRKSYKVVQRVKRVCSREAFKLEPSEYE